MLRADIFSDAPLRSRLQFSPAGQERFRTIAQAYFRGAHGVLLVYDVTNERSFANVRRWADDVDRQTALSDGGGGSSVLKIVVGNKCDLAAERVVDAARGSALAAELGVRFFETSAKTGASVDEAFQTLITDVFERAYGVGGAAAPKTVGGIVKLAAAQLKNAGGAHDVSASAAGGNINSSSSGSSSSGGGASPSKSDSACCT